jgi:hypothetical protein
MRAAWYDRQGRGAEVLQVGEVPEPEPGRGEVRVHPTRQVGSLVAYSCYEAWTRTTFNGS